MYDVIYFNVWSDIICTAAKLLHGTSAFAQEPGLTRTGKGDAFELLFCPQSQR